MPMGLMTSSDRNIFRVTGPFCGEFTIWWRHHACTEHTHIYIYLYIYIYYPRIVWNDPTSDIILPHSWWKFMSISIKTHWQYMKYIWLPSDNILRPTILPSPSQPFPGSADFPNCSKGSVSCHCMHYDVIKWKHFPRYWPFVRGTTSHRRIPHTKASDAELWYLLWSLPEKTFERTIETPVIWDAITLIMASS